MADCYYDEYMPAVSISGASRINQQTTPMLNDEGASYFAPDTPRKSQDVAKSIDGEHFERIVELGPDAKGQHASASFNGHEMVSQQSLFA